MKFIAAILVFVTINTCVSACSDRYIRMAEKEAALFYGVPKDIRIGTVSFENALSSVVIKYDTFDSFIKYLVNNSDRTDYRFGLLYVGGDIKVTLMFDHPSGLIVSQVELRISNGGRIEVLDSAIRLLKGTYVATEDTVLVEEVKREMERTKMKK